MIANMNAKQVPSNHGHGLTDLDMEKEAVYPAITMNSDKSLLPNFLGKVSFCIAIEVIRF